MAYAKALEKLTGVEMTKMLPIPNLENKAFSETRKFEEKGLHRAIYLKNPKRPSCSPQSDIAWFFYCSALYDGILLQKYD